MQEINPTTHEVLSVYILSVGSSPDDEDKERKTHLGLFDSSVDRDEIKEGLEKNHEVLGKIIGSQSFFGDSPTRLEVRQSFVQEGIIFDSIDECLQYLRHGLTYADICDGVRIHTEKVIEGVS